jgi:hypothetical protein
LQENDELKAMLLQQAAQMKMMMEMMSKQGLTPNTTPSNQTAVAKPVPDNCLLPQKGPLSSSANSKNDKPNLQLSIQDPSLQHVLI